MNTQLKTFAVTMVRFDVGEFTVNTSAMTEKEAGRQMFNKYIRPVLKIQEVSSEETGWHRV